MADPILDKVTEIGKFLGSGTGSLTESIQGVLAEGGFLEELFKQVGKLAETLTKAFGEEFAKVSDKVAKSLNDVTDKLFDHLGDTLGDLASLPSGLQKGPEDAFNSLREFGSFLNDIGQLAQIKKRIKASESSITQLFKIASGKPANKPHDIFPEDVLFQTAFSSVSKLLSDAIDPNGGSLPTLLLNALKSIISVKPLVGSLLSGLSNKKMWSWGSLPSGIQSGQLNEWLNTLGRFTKENGDLNPDLNNAGDREFVHLQRLFRVRMIAAADCYLRRKLNDEQFLSQLSEADSTTAAQLLAEVITVFAKTHINFVLEPECYPIHLEDWDGFEDVGFRVGELLSGQLRVAIRSTIGLMLNGIWDWTVLSPPLIELTATSISTLVSSIIEGVIRNISFSLRIVSTYYAADGTLPGELHRWSSLDYIQNSFVANEQIQYVAFGRIFPQGLVLPSQVKKILEDIGAYLDVSYQRFRFENRFLPPDPAETVHIARAEIIANKLYLEATTTTAYQVPQPVLRAYVCCDVIPLKPGATPADPYTLEFPLTNMPRCKIARVLSNRGGQAERSITSS